MRNLYVVLLAAVLLMVSAASSAFACSYDDASANTGTTQTASNTNNGG